MLGSSVGWGPWGLSARGLSPQSRSSFFPSEAQFSSHGGGLARVPRKNRKIVFQKHPVLML